RGAGAPPAPRLAAQEPGERPRVEAVGLGPMPLRAPELGRPVRVEQHDRPTRRPQVFDERQGVVARPPPPHPPRPPPPAAAPRPPGAALHDDPEGSAAPPPPREVHPPPPGRPRRVVDGGPVPPLARVHPDHEPRHPRTSSWSVGRRGSAPAPSRPIGAAAR